MTYDELIEFSHDHPVLFFDGVCNLCNGFINTVIDHDPSGIIKFCILQNETGLVVRDQLSLGTDISTTIGIYKGKTYTHSDVLHMVVKSLRGWWLILSPFYILPKSFRDLVYNWVARNRYNWFGQTDQCMVPSPPILSRFLT